MNDAVVEDNYSVHSLLIRDNKNFSQENKKISSARAGLSKQQRKLFSIKFSLFILSNKTNKLFPSDFFDAVGKERNIKTGVMSTKKSSNFTEDLSKTNNATNDSSKSSFLRGPSSPNYITSQFEMIPEVEDEKFNTLYDKNNQRSSKDECNILYMKRYTKFNFNQYTDKEENINPHENSDRLSDIENKFINNPKSEKIKNLNKSNNFTIPLKLDITNSNGSKIRTKSIEEINLHKNKSPTNLNPFKFTVKPYEREITQTACFSHERLESKASYCEKKEIENIMSDGEVYERKKVNDQRVVESLDKKKIYKSQTKVKLPLIKTSRPNINSKINKKEISNLFDACLEFKKDPEINEKLNDLMFKIVDLKNVISSKSNTRFKISSAPSQMKKGSFCDKSSSVITKDQADNLTFSKLPNFNENGITGNKLNEIKATYTNKMIFNTGNNKINSFNKGNFFKNQSNKSVVNIDNKVLNFQESKIVKKNFYIKKI